MAASGTGIATIDLRHLRMAASFAVGLQTATGHENQDHKASITILDNGNGWLRGTERYRFKDGHLKNQPRLAHRADRNHCGCYSTAIPCRPEPDQSSMLIHKTRSTAGITEW
jgi:hypothetical protein